MSSAASTTTTTTTEPVSPLDAPVVTSATCQVDLGCDVARIMFRPVDGADRYVVTHPDLDDATCFGPIDLGTCFVEFDDTAPGGIDFRLVAVDDAGHRGKPSAPFGIRRLNGPSGAS
jgi:hypothetical protein